MAGGNSPAAFRSVLNSLNQCCATGVLAIRALLAGRIRALSWSFIVAFNVVGTIDIIVDYYHAVQTGLPAMAGQLGNTYAIAIIYVPLLMITHVIAFYFLLRSAGSRVVETTKGEPICTIS